MMPKVNASSNATVHEYAVKLRADGVYDIYIDGKLLISKGSADSALASLKEFLIQDL